MIINEKGKLFGKISIIDILIALIIIGFISFICFKFANSKIIGSSDSEQNYLLLFYQEEIPDSAAKSIKTGDVIIDFVQNAEIGSVEEINVDKSISWSQTEKGDFVPSTKQGYSSLKMKVKVKGVNSDRGFKIGTIKYYIGKSIDIRVGNTAANPRLESITASKE